MLFLLFHLGSERYALPASDVVEVLPLVALKHLPHAPRGVVGLLNYRGQPVPVLDLSLLALGQPAVQRVSTRILITGAKPPEGGAAPTRDLLGVLVERATEAFNKDTADFRPAGLVSPVAPYFGSVAPDARGFIQRVELDELRRALDLPAAEALAR